MVISIWGMVVPGPINWNDKIGCKGPGQGANWFARAWEALGQQNELPELEATWSPDPLTVTIA